MRIECLVLIEGQNVSEGALSIGLTNAKQVVIGSIPGSGDVILHVAADSPDYMRDALLRFAQIPGVTDALILRASSQE